MPLTATADLQALLRRHRVQPTLQRLAVAQALLRHAQHLTAEQTLQAARRFLPDLSRATEYAVLKLFARQGLIRELPIEGAATVYDSNPQPHHHLYDVDTGQVRDLPVQTLQVLGVAQALGGLELAGVDVIVRVRGLPADRACQPGSPLTPP